MQEKGRKCLRMIFSSQKLSWKIELCTIPCMKFSPIKIFCWQNFHFHAWKCHFSCMEIHLCMKIFSCHDFFMHETFHREHPCRDHPFSCLSRDRPGCMDEMCDPHISSRVAYFSTSASLPALMSVSSPTGSKAEHMLPVEC